MGTLNPTHSLADSNECLSSSYNRSTTAVVQCHSYWIDPTACNDDRYTQSNSPPAALFERPKSDL